MKKIIYIALTVAAAFCFSCTKQDYYDVSLSNREIGFSTYSGRSVETKAESPDPFLVEAYYKGSKYFDAQTVTFSNSVWNLSTAYFWPATVDATNKMEFYAVRKKSGESHTFTGKVVTVGTALAADADIRTSYAVATAVPSGAQALNFTHDLAKMKFTLKAADPNLTYTVTAMKVTAKKTGTLTLNTGAKTWATTGTAADYAITITDAIKNPTTTQGSAFGETNVIPQTGVKISVTYKVETSGGVTILAETTKTTTVNLSTNSGKSTQYNLTLPSGTSGTAEMSVTCNVTDWNSQSDAEQAWDEPKEPEGLYLKFSASSLQTLNIEMGQMYYQQGKEYNGILYSGDSNLLPNYEYSYDGKNWTAAPIKISSNSSSYKGIPFGTSGKENLYLRGKSKETPVIGIVTSTVGNGYFFTTHFSFSENSPVACAGNVMALINDPDKPLELTIIGEFAGMFYNCSVLTSAPSLPATKLTQACYSCMFTGCENLVHAPDLPATDIDFSTTGMFSSVYCKMFSGCTSLNYVKAYATNFNKVGVTVQYSGSFYNFLNNASSSGVFYGPKDGFSDYYYDQSLYPSGWTYSKIPVNE